ncbi:uncharacterized protein LOC113149108 isoform X4 [Anabas testudineus]|uniref:uncharacterized protein LOC113149108 isoform X4 n=1 Tax=Anabas testudineus TaxID=64144 RepID=UPI000E45B9FD|nr:uncharacterized protein LOC113149108 isoform X4 [Anabas testudineus]
MADSMGIQLKWWYVTVPVAAVVLIIIVLLIIWKKVKGKKMKTEDNNGLNLNSAETQPGPEPTEDMTNPDIVSYASISFINGKAQNKNEDEDGGVVDEGDAVTYSTVKTSSFSAGSSTDPSDLYATVN